MGTYQGENRYVCVWARLCLCYNDSGSLARTSTLGTTWNDESGNASHGTNDESADSINLHSSRSAQSSDCPTRTRARNFHVRRRDRATRHSVIFEANRYIVVDV